ncbi:MAG: hypothetical protein ACFFB4_07045 [Promethearchaeota archaeon]
MSDEMQQLHRSAYKSYSVILGDGFILFTKSWLTIIVPMTFLSIISIIIQSLIITDMNWNFTLMTSEVEIILNKDPTSITNADLQVLLRYLSLYIGIIVLQSLIGAFFTVLAMCSVSSYLLKKLKGLDVKFFQEVKTSFNSKLFIVLVLLGVVVPLGTTLLIPGLILFKLYIFSLFTYNDENIIKPLKESRFIAKKTFWKTIGIFLIAFGVPFLINFFVYHPIFYFVFPNRASWYDPATRNYLMIILYNFLYQLTDILLAPLFICLLASFYTSLKSRSAIVYRYQTEPIQTRYRSSESEAAKPKEQNTQGYKFDSGLYCPYCGFFMETKLERCPQCKESLDFQF